MCRSENAASKNPRYAFIQLEVRYAPEVELRISSSNPNDGSIVKEGDDLTMECVAAGNPSRMTFKWTRDGIPVTSGAEGVASGDGTPRLVFRRVGREFHQTVIACEVTNAVGTSRAKMEVNVAYKPRFVKLPEAIIGLEKGEKSKLNCKVDSHPKANIVWSKLVQKVLPNDSESSNHNRIVEHWQEVGEGASIEADSAGRYRCNAKNTAFDDELKGETFVFIKGAPTIRSASVQFGNENESVRLQCIVEAIPPPTKITWFKMKPHLQILGVDNNEGYEISEEEDPDDFSMIGNNGNLPQPQNSANAYISGNDKNLESAPFLSLLRSIISIRRARDSDFDKYNCSVWNQYGFSSQIITLQKQETYLSPLLLTLGGIFGTGVIFVISASILVFACIRGQRLKDHEVLGHKKHENSTDRIGVLPNGVITNDNDLEKKSNTMNSLTEKNMALGMKNTVMQMHSGSGQIRTTLLHNGDHHSSMTNGAYLPTGDAPLYSDYDYHHYAQYGTTAAGTNDLLVNTSHQPSYGYDNISAYSATYDYAHAMPAYAPEKNQIGIPNFQPDPTHLYSTVVKNNLNKTHSNMMNSSNIANYQSLLVKTDIDPNGTSNSAYGRGKNNPIQNQNQFQRQFSNQQEITNNSDPTRMLNVNGVYNSTNSAQRFTAVNNTNNSTTKTNSLGGGSSSSGVISNGASSPGHSPVGSATVSNGTHV